MGCDLKKAMVTSIEEEGKTVSSSTVIVPLFVFKKHSLPSFSKKSTIFLRKESLFTQKRLSQRSQYEINN